MPNRAIPYVKVLVHLLCLLPALVLLRMYLNGTLALEADPVNYITHFTGNWASVDAAWVAGNYSVAAAGYGA